MTNHPAFRFLHLFIASMFMLTCRTASRRDESGLRLHYLGHSSFILAFGNGVTVLTDYGESRAYGLDSPVYDAGDLKPDLVLYSHHHPDHDRGKVFEGAAVVDGGSLRLKGLEIRAIPVSENAAGDKAGYLFTYRGRTVFHAGDCQGDMAGIASGDSVACQMCSRVPGAPGW